MATTTNQDDRAQAGLIRLSDEELRDIAHGITILDNLENDLAKARLCQTPGCEEAIAQAKETRKRLAAYLEQFGGVPSPKFRARARKP